MFELREIDLTPNGLKDCSDLLSSLLGKRVKKSINLLRWLYLENPNGKAIGYNAYCEGNLASTYANLPVNFNINGNRVKGLLAVNAATYPKYAGKDLFKKTAEKCFQLACYESYEIIIAVTNYISTKIFVKKLGFDFIQPLEAKIGFGLKGILDGLYAGEYNFFIERDNRELLWRFSNPENHYFEVENTHKILFLSKSKYPFINVVVEKINYNDNFRSFASTYSPMNVWVGIDKNMNWRKLPYFDIPDKIKPSPLNLVVKFLNNKYSKKDLSNIRISAFDFDAF